METTDNQPQKISGIADRIKQLLDAKGLNASSASKELGYTVPSKLYGILSGASLPGFVTLTDMLERWSDLSAEWLLRGRGQMLVGEAVQAASRLLVGPRMGSVVGGASRVLAVTVGLDGEENIEFVPIRVQAGYTRHHNEPVFHEQLRHYRVPGFDSGTFRAFEVAGDSMEPTFNHHDIVVASFVDNWQLLEPGGVYVVVTSESLMLKRLRARIMDENQEVILYSDNYHCKPYSLEASEISQLWRVRGYISTYLPSAPDVTAERLWEVIDMLGFDKGEVRRHLENGPNSGPSV